MPLDNATLARDVEGIPADADLRKVSELADVQVSLESQIDNTERALTSLKKEYERVRSELLPAALREQGLKEITLTDGSRVRVVEILRASIPKAKQLEAFAWLDANGYGDIIKHVVSASFAAGEGEKATQAYESLGALGITADEKRSVHPQTLGAFVREQTEAGVALPEHLLGVYRGEQTKIERPKA
ncbi:MAG: gp33 family protein [Planctomycetota bacterium]|jgi:hypothetical protein